MSHYTEHCGECREPICMTHEREKYLRETGAIFYCPRGHTRVFRDSENKKLRDQVARLEADRDWWRKRADHWQAEATRIELRRRAQVSATTRLRNARG